MKGFTTVLLLGIALSGCVTPPDSGAPVPTDTLSAEMVTTGDPELTSGENSTRRLRLEEELGAVSKDGPYNVKDWFLLATSTGPERPLAGFRWTVPKGALVPDSTGGNRTTLALELAPLFPEGEKSSLTQFILEVHRLEGKELNHLADFARGEWNETSKTTTALEERYHYKYVDPGPAYLWTVNDGASNEDDGTIEEGDTLYFVLATDSEVESEFGLAIRILDRDPYPACGPLGCTGQPQEPSNDFATFKQKVSGPPIAPPRTGNGAGFRFAVYNHGSLGPFFYQGWSKDVTIKNALPVDPSGAATLRDLTLSYEFPSRAGWVNGGGGLGSYAVAGRWEVDASVHGTRLATGQYVVPGASILGTGFWTWGDGIGGSRVSFHVTEAALASDYLYFFYVDFGTPISQLLGVPVEKGTTTWPLETARASGGHAPPAVLGDDLVIEAGNGAKIQLVGAARALGVSSLEAGA